MFGLGVLANAAKDLGKSAWEGVKKNLASGQGGGGGDKSGNGVDMSYSPGAIAQPTAPTNAAPPFTPQPMSPTYGPMTQTEGTLLKPIASPQSTIGGPISADQIPTRRKSLLFPIDGQ